jgi:hypothetical protein
MCSKRWLGTSRAGNFSKSALKERKAPKRWFCIPLAGVEVCALSALCAISPPKRWFGRFSQSGRRASPGFPVDLFGVGELHAAFLNESRTRGRWWCPVAGNPGRPSFSSHVRLGERGAPVRFPLTSGETSELEFFLFLFGGGQGRARKASTAFRPPKAKDWERAASACFVRDWFGITSSSHSGSG